MPAPRQARRDKRPPRPLTPETLRVLALHYVGRYATSSGKLGDYLKRKLRERGWESEVDADISRLIENFAESGYIDDAGYASARKASLLRRGFGPQRVGQALRFSGVSEQIAADHSTVDEDTARQAAFDFARRKRIGPFARQAGDSRDHERAVAAMLRAGHAYALVREILAAVPET